MLIPTYCRSQPTICFGDIAPRDLRVEERLIRYCMRSSGDHKSSVRL